MGDSNDPQALGEGKLTSMMATIAATKLEDLTRTRTEGRPVNTHVVPSRSIKAPDFEQMKKLVHSSDNEKEPEKPKPQE